MYFQRSKDEGILVIIDFLFGFSSNMKRLIESKKISGALVIHADINGDNKTHRPECKCFYLLAIL